MSFLKKLISFFYPMMVESRSGKINPYLEVLKQNGKLVLNSQMANYSFGGVHVIFDRFLQSIGIKEYQFKNVLILGMGAGSIIQLLKEKYQLTCHITAVERDEVVIELAKKHFRVGDYDDLTIVHADAFEFTSLTTEKYDLIISDIFIEQNVPEIFATVNYLSNLKRIANNHACIIYNKMTEQEVHKKELLILMENFKKFFANTRLFNVTINHSQNSIIFSNSLLRKQEVMDHAPADDLLLLVK